MTSYRTWIEISASAFHHNIQQLATIVQKKQAQFGLVIKANAYGHGLLHIARLANEHPVVSWLIVGDVAEALAVRKIGIQKALLALTWSPDLLAEALYVQVDIAVTNLEQLEQLYLYAQSKGLRANIHLKIETGLMRLGIFPEDIDHCIEKLLTMRCIQLRGIFTHLAETEDALESAHKQLEIFRGVQQKFTAQGFDFMVHALASGGISLLSDNELIRIGTSAYGLYKSPLHEQRLKNIQAHVALLPVLTWKTHIIQVKTIQPGAFVGYNRTFCAQKEMKVAILPVGYFDGYMRGLSNKAWVAIDGIKAPVIGVVSMNLLAVDITTCQKTVAPGDEVILLGGNGAPSAGQLATLVGTLDREILTHINPMIPRLIVD